jgi:hypothetical protein
MVAFFHASALGGVERDQAKVGRTLGRSVADTARHYSTTHFQLCKETRRLRWLWAIVIGQALAQLR